MVSFKRSYRRPSTQQSREPPRRHRMDAVFHNSLEPRERIGGRDPRDFQRNRHSDRAANRSSRQHNPRLAAFDNRARRRDNGNSPRGYRNYAASSGSDDGSDDFTFSEAADSPRSNSSVDSYHPRRDSYSPNSSYRSESRPSFTSAYRPSMKVLNQERLLNGEAVEVRLRNTDFRRIEELQIGDIISLPVHTQSHVRRVYIDDTNRTYAGDFGAIQSKFRKIILTGNAGSGKSGVPIFTYGDRGLEGKTEEEASEHCHIRDIKDESPKAASLEGRVLRAIRDVDWPDHCTFIRAPSVVNLTTSITVLPGDRCSLEVRLEQHDLLHLLVSAQYHHMKSSIKAIQVATGLSILDYKVEDGVDRAEAEADAS